jgi:hypothetical protein
VLRVACCVLRVACCVLRVACCVSLPTIRLAILRRFWLKEPRPQPLPQQDGHGAGGKGET